VRPGQAPFSDAARIGENCADEVLNRKRKAFVSGPRDSHLREWNGLYGDDSVQASNSLGIVDEKYFSEPCQRPGEGKRDGGPAVRVVGDRVWLRNLRASGIVDLDNNSRNT